MLSFLSKIAIMAMLLFSSITLWSCADKPSEDSSDGDSDSDTDTGSDGDTDSDSDGDSDSDSDGDSDSDTDSATETDNEGDRLIGPADSLYIDGSIHTGISWGGENYEGVWGEPFEFLMSNYPISWAIALVHASMLYKSRDMDFDPNTVLAHAIRLSKLECDDPDSLSHNSGCFLLDENAGFIELRRIFPLRFGEPYDDLISGNHFEASAISSFYYSLFNINMFRMYTDDPIDFFKEHPDDKIALKALVYAYKEGPLWPGLAAMFTDCQEDDALDCLNEDALMLDYSRSILDYTDGFNTAKDFDIEITKSDLEFYWGRIDELYPEFAYSETGYSEILDEINDAFDEVSRGDTISFKRDIKYVLKRLIEKLPEVETHEETTLRACQFYIDELPAGLCPPL